MRMHWPFLWIGKFGAVYWFSNVYLRVDLLYVTRNIRLSGSIVQWALLYGPGDQKYIENMRYLSDCEKHYVFGVCVCFLMRGKSSKNTPSHFDCGTAGLCRISPTITSSVFFLSKPNGGLRDISKIVTCIRGRPLITWCSFKYYLLVEVSDYLFLPKTTCFFGGKKIIKKSDIIQV